MMTAYGMDPVRGLTWCMECGALVLHKDAHRHSAWHHALDDKLQWKTRTDDDE